VRFDVERVGESDGDQPASIESLHGDDLVEQLDLIMDAMRAKLGCRRFIAIGLCSGGFAAFQSLIRNPAIRNAVLLNPRLFFWDPAVEPQRLAKRVGAGLSDASYWRRLARGEFQLDRLMQAARVALNRFLLHRNVPGAPQQLPAEALTHAWQQVARFESRVALVFADGEPLLQEMIEEKQMPPSNNPLIQLMQVGKTGHTFRALWAQQLVQDLIDREVGSTVHDDWKLERPSSFSEGVPAVA
jgi:pimeloyl-ACP methyl ester carboxylesterase